MRSSAKEVLGLDLAKQQKKDILKRAEAIEKFAKTQESTGEDTSYSFKNSVDMDAYLCSDLLDGIYFEVHRKDGRELARFNNQVFNAENPFRASKMSTLLSLHHDVFSQQVKFCSVELQNSEPLMTLTAEEGMSGFVINVGFDPDKVEYIP